MPQTFVVLQCAFCNAYQVTLDKKAKKFSCAICSEKQSFRTVHAISNSAKDCRKVVQELNSLRGAKDQQLDSYEAAAMMQAATDAVARVGNGSSPAAQAVEWDAFADADDTNGSDNDDDRAGQFVTALPDSSHSRSIGSNARKRRKVANNLEADADCEQPMSYGAVTNSRSSYGASRLQPNPASRLPVQRRTQQFVQSQQQKPGTGLPQQHLQANGQRSSFAGKSADPVRIQQPWAGDVVQQCGTSSKAYSSSGASAARFAGAPLQQVSLPNGGSQRWQPQQQHVQQQGWHGQSAAGTTAVQQQQQRQPLAPIHSTQTSWGQQQQAELQSRPVRKQLAPLPAHTLQQRQQHIQQQQCQQKKAQPSAAAGAWGAFIDTDNAGACNSDDDRDVDEQGFCCLASPTVDGSMNSTGAPSSTTSRWAS